MTIDQEYSIVVLVVGFLMILAELFLGVDTAFDLVIIGTILVISALLGYASSSIIIVLIFASVLSVLYFFIGRGYLQERLQTPHIPTNIEALPGKEGKAIKNFTKGKGIVKIEGEEWTARSKDRIKSGDRVSVIKSETNTLLVKKIK